MDLTKLFLGEVPINRPVFQIFQTLLFVKWNDSQKYQLFTTILRTFKFFLSSDQFGENYLSSRKKIIENFKTWCQENDKMDDFNLFRIFMKTHFRF